MIDITKSNMFNKSSDNIFKESSLYKLLTDKYSLKAANEFFVEPEKWNGSLLEQRLNVKRNVISERIG